MSVLLLVDLQIVRGEKPLMGEFLLLRISYMDNDKGSYCNMIYYQGPCLNLQSKTSDAHKTESMTCFDLLSEK